LSRLSDILDGETRDYIANHNLEEVVRSTNRVPTPSGSIGEEVGDTLSDITTGRLDIQKLILQSANEKASDLGIIILDVRLKRLNYVEEVKTQVYERMKSERYRIAEKSGRKGQGASRSSEKERVL
jgi:membrane protease subunit HflC